MLLRVVAPGPEIGGSFGPGYGEVLNFSAPSVDEPALSGPGCERVCAFRPRARASLRVLAPVVWIARFVAHVAGLVADALDGDRDVGELSAELSAHGRRAAQRDGDARQIERRLALE